jgi:hypothetical protein
MAGGRNVSRPGRHLSLPVTALAFWARGAPPAGPCGPAHGDQGIATSMPR